MKIYINARFLLQHPTGVERYAFEMCCALVRTGANITLLCPKHGDIDSAYDVSSFNICRYGLGKSHLWEQLILPFFFLFKKNYIVISFTGLGSILVPHKYMTIHDLSFLVNRSWFSNAYYWYYKIMTPLAVKTSKGIITVSEFSKKEILRFYSFVSPDDIHVIYNAVDNNKFYDRKETRQNFFLAVSSIDPRKNFKSLLDAFHDLGDYKLKIVGGTNKVFGNVDKCDSNNNIEFLGRVSDAELSALYSRAAAFIFPSLYEGFGLPPIEAMASACPVLVSDIQVMHEVCQSSACYFDSLNPKAIHQAIRSFIELNPLEKDDLMNKGLENVKRFSWNESAKKLLNIIDN